MDKYFWGVIFASAALAATWSTYDSEAPSSASSEFHITHPENASSRKTEEPFPTPPLSIEQPFQATKVTVTAHHKNQKHQAPADSTRDPSQEDLSDLPSSPFLESDRLAEAPPVKIAQSNTTDIPAETPAHAVELPTEEQPSPMAAPLQPSEVTNISWFKLGASTRTLQSTLSGASEIHDNVQEPLTFLMEVFVGISEYWGFEWGWNQKLLKNDHPLNIMNAGIVITPHVHSLPNTLWGLHLGTTQEQATSWDDTAADAAEHRNRSYNDIDIYAGFSVRQMLSVLWSLDVSLLIQNSLTKPDPFANYQKNGWSIIIEPQYEFEKDIHLGFKVAYGVKNKNFEWSGSSDRKQSEDHDLQSGIFIRFSF